MQVTCYLNDYGAEAVIERDSSESYIDEMLALDLLKKGAINRTNFQGNFEEIMAKEQPFKAAGGRWIVYVPRVQVLA